jgi:hypothetical protein
VLIITYLLYLHMLCMASAVILVVSATFTARRKNAGWFKRHRVCASAGVLLALLGIASVFVFKLSMQYPHIKSPHAFAGILTLILLILTPLPGFLIASNPKTYRKIHRAMGKITSLAIVVTALMGIGRFIRLLIKK